MSQPLFSIGGIASGLDTQAILDQLIRLERQPIVRFQQQQADLRKVDEAWGRVVTRLSSLRSAIDQLRRPDGFSKLVTATSSKPEAVAATVTGSPAPGSVSFTVSQLATQHQVAAGGTFTSPDAAVGEGTITLSRDGEQIGSVTTDGTKTLRDVAHDINRLGVGVSAQVLKTGDDAYRLVLTAKDTGQANAFTVGGDALAGQEVLHEGRDAVVKLGTLEVQRSSNTVTDLVDGITLDLRQATGDTPVTVTTSHDVDGAVAAVKKLVDAANGLLSQAADLSKFDAESRAAGPLQGDATLRRLVTDLRQAVSAAVPGLRPGNNHGSAVGIGLDRGGRITLDESQLRAALTDDFDGVARLFGRTAATDDPRLAATATDRTPTGTFEVKISQAAAIAAFTGATYSPPSGDPKTFTITVGGETVQVTIDEDAGIASAISAINKALTDAKVSTLKASERDGAIHLEATRYGSAHSFSVDGSGDLGLDGNHEGRDVVGEIGGVAATGRGRTLSADEDVARGLTVTVSATEAQVDAAGGTLDLGEVTVTHGIGGALDRVLRHFEGSGGAVARAREALTNQIRQVDTRIAAFETRIESREVTLRRQFTALESAMGQLQSQSAWLTSQLAALQAPRL